MYVENEYSKQLMTSAKAHWKHIVFAEKCGRPL